MTPDRTVTIIKNALVTLTSIIVTLAILEASLRLFFHRYEDAAQAQFQADSLRITSRPPNTRREGRHPDTARVHEVIYNNFGMRQHRNFAEAELQSGINIAFFGDSYTENVGLPGPFSFTEPLDYLLNLGGKPVNVLNFGQDGYGTGQSYTSYRYSPLREHIDHVYYVFCLNDIRNIYENNLFRLDEHRRLQRNPAVKPPWWIRVLSRLHITYLVQETYRALFPHKNNWEGFDARIMQEKFGDKDVRARRESPQGQALEDDLLRKKSNQDLQESLSIFDAILSEWASFARRNDASFTVVFLPTGRGQPILKRIQNSYDTVDLYTLFRSRIPDFDYNNWRFEKDWHWNAAANRMAAALLYEQIATQLNVTPPSVSDTQEALHTYYAAFDYGQSPEPKVSTTATSEGLLAAIRRKYTALNTLIETSL